jgi:very-short-patch-repair endonuclease
MWKNPSYREKTIVATLKHMSNRPTTFERKIINLCSKYRLPFVYTGDGRLLIGFKNPDFVCESNKIVIEVFLNYFKIRDYGSLKKYMKIRGNHFLKYGYSTIFINENDISDVDSEYICLQKIVEKLENSNDEILR